jgi:hypothetical protein
MSKDIVIFWISQTGSSESVLERPNKFQPVFTMVNVVSFFALKSSEGNKLLLTSNRTWLESQSLKILKQS